MRLPRAALLFVQARGYFEGSNPSVTRLTAGSHRSDEGRTGAARALAHRSLLFVNARLRAEVVSALASPGPMVHRARVREWCRKGQAEAGAGAAA